MTDDEEDDELEPVLGDLNFHFVRVTDQFDTERCQGVHRRHQCWYKAVPGMKCCPRHGRLSHSKYSIKGRKMLYRLGKWQERVSEFANSSELKKLNQEIGIIRMTLEEIMTSAKDSYTLTLSAGRISHLVKCISELVLRTHQLEIHSGMHLNSEQLLAIAERWASIVQRYVQDEKIIDAIARDFAAEFSPADGRQNSGIPYEESDIQAQHMGNETTSNGQTVRGSMELLALPLAHSTA